MGYPDMDGLAAFDSSGDSLDKYEFTFESYLDDSASIEPDVSPALPPYLVSADTNILNPSPTL